MYILALETSTRSPNIALARDNQVIKTGRLEPHQSTAGDLIPAIESLLSATDLVPADIELVAVSVGPGSFTGLRVGLTIAKTWCHITGAALVAVDVFEILAGQVPPTPVLSPVIPAQRGQVFAALFEWNSGDENYRAIEAESWWSPEEWLSRVPPETVFTGPGTRLMEQAYSGELSRSDPRTWEPQAETVARLGWKKHSAGQRDDPKTVVPRYLRPSAAEEKRMRARREIESRKD